MHYFHYKFMNVFLYIISILKVIKTEIDRDVNKYCLYKLEFKTLNKEYEEVIYDDFENIKDNKDFEDIFLQAIRIYYGCLIKRMYLIDIYGDMSSCISESIYKEFFLEKSDLQENDAYIQAKNYVKKKYTLEILSYIPCNLLKKWNEMKRNEDITDYIEENDKSFNIIVEELLTIGDYRDLEKTDIIMQILLEVLKKMPHYLRDVWAKKIEKDNLTFINKKNKEILNLIIQVIFQRKHVKYCERNKNDIYNYTEEQEVFAFIKDLLDYLTHKSVSLFQGNVVDNLDETCKKVVDLIVSTILDKYYYEVEKYKEFKEYINESIEWWKDSMHGFMLIYQKNKSGYIKHSESHIHIEKDYFLNIDYLEEKIRQIYNEIEINYLYIKYIKKRTSMEIEIAENIPNDLKEQWINVIKENRLYGPIKEDDELIGLISQSIYAIIINEIEKIGKIKNPANISHIEEKKVLEDIRESLKEECVNQIKRFLKNCKLGFPRKGDTLDNEKEKPDTYAYECTLSQRHYGKFKNSRVGPKNINEIDKYKAFATEAISKRLMVFLASKCPIYSLKDYLKKREKVAFEIDIFRENDYELIECEKIESLIESNSEKLSEGFIIDLHILHCFGKEVHPGYRIYDNEKLDENSMNDTKLFYEFQMENYPELLNRIKKICLLIMKNPKTIFNFHAKVTESFYELNKNMFSFVSSTKKQVLSKKKVEAYCKTNENIRTELALFSNHLKIENKLKIPIIKKMKPNQFY